MPSGSVTYLQDGLPVNMPMGTADIEGPIHYGWIERSHLMFLALAGDETDPRSILAGLVSFLSPTSMLLRGVISNRLYLRRAKASRVNRDVGCRIK